MNFYEYTKTAFKYIVFLSIAVLFKKNEDFELSQQRKKYLKYLILTHQGNQALRFFHFS